MPDYKEEIKKTGFILENTIVKKLKQHSWNIISNKYYEDDVVETVREIDILAYKISQVDEISIYTALLISCKKSDENAWALICRDINLSEPNSNWWPLHIWSNDSPIKQVLNGEGFNKEYYKYMYEDKSISVMEPPAVDIFAFQQMNKSNGRPQNDKEMFSSITTLMKAQSYEMGALHTRKRNKCVYQFNLLSIIDSDLVKLHIDANDDISESFIDSEQMVARYIIRKQEQFFRIRFIKADAFDAMISSFNSLHNGNVELLRSERNNWLNNSITDYKKVRLLQSEFFNEVAPYISDAVVWDLGRKEISESAFLLWEPSQNKLRIFVTENEGLTARLRGNDVLAERTAFFLKKIYHFEGDFFYSNDPVPF